MKYYEKVMNFSLDDFWEELNSLWILTEQDPKLFSILKNTAGDFYLIRELTSKLYLNGKPINISIRKKIRALSIYANPDMNIGQIKENLKRERNSWYKKNIEELLKAEQARFLKLCEEL